MKTLIPICIATAVIAVGCKKEGMNNPAIDPAANQSVDPAVQHAPVPMAATTAVNIAQLPWWQHYNIEWERLTGKFLARAYVRINNSTGYTVSGPVLQNGVKVNNIAPTVLKDAGGFSYGVWQGTTSTGLFNCSISKQTTTGEPMNFTNSFASGNFPMLPETIGLKTSYPRSGFTILPAYFYLKAGDKVSVYITNALGQQAVGYAMLPGGAGVSSVVYATGITPAFIFESGALSKFAAGSTVTLTIEYRRDGYLHYVDTPGGTYTLTSVRRVTIKLL